MKERKVDKRGRDVMCEETRRDIKKKKQHKGREQRTDKRDRRKTRKGKVKSKVKGVVMKGDQWLGVKEGNEGKMREWGVMFCARR